MPEDRFYQLLGSDVPVPGAALLSGEEELRSFWVEHFGEAAASEQMAHERDHVDVYQQYGIPVRYGFVITKTPIGDRYIPFVTPEFPPDMDTETRYAIMVEAAGRPDRLSYGDKAFLENIKKKPL